MVDMLFKDLQDIQLVKYLYIGVVKEVIIVFVVLDFVVNFNLVSCIDMIIYLIWVVFVSGFMVFDVVEDICIRRQVFFFGVIFRVVDVFEFQSFYIVKLEFKKVMGDEQFVLDRSLVWIICEEEDFQCVVSL